MAPQICLTMIVKDEAHIIRRCLEVARPMFDTWVIVDTGSTDGTQDVIRDVLAGVPGQLHERPWKDFAHNRTEAIELARGMADYLLFVDADDNLRVPDGFVRPELTAEAYELEFRLGAILYRRTCLVRSDLPWRFEGVIHEYPTLGRTYVPECLAGPLMDCTRDGNRSAQSDVDKYSQDAAILEAALADDPSNTRYAFYLAQSYRDSLQPEKALTAYEHRSTMGGFDQEVYIALLQAARVARGLGSPPAEVIDRLLRAYDARPSRVEALGDLAILCRELGGRWGSALMFAERGLAIPPSQDSLFVEPAWHSWRLLDEKSIALYWLEDYKASLEACDLLLDKGVVPKDQRDRVRENHRFAAEKLGVRR
ncbi:MAG: family 2 glycosyl transferase [Marmoricola sp.]|nr:family 2 glycosyl transferase [Marmoricola sp.]